MTYFLEALGFGLFVAAIATWLVLTSGVAI
jgi:hypothetical protein